MAGFLRNIVLQSLNWKFFLICNFLILGLKIGLFVYQGFPSEYYEDWYIAQNVVNRHLYSLGIEHGSSAYKLPAYPLFVSLYMKIFGIPQAAKFIILTQYLFYFVEAIVLVKIFENFNQKRAGFLAAYLFLFSPAYFYYANSLEATNIFLLFFIAWVYLFSCIWQKASPPKIIALAVLTGLVSLTQVVAVPVLILLLLVLFLYKKISFSRLVLIFALAGLVYSPWVIRNYMTFDRLILTKSPYWQNLYVGYTPKYQIFDHQFMMEKEKEAIFYETRNASEFEDEKIFEREVRRMVWQDPYAPYKKAFNNLVSLWYVPQKYMANQSLSILVGRKMYVVLIDLLLAVSLVYFYRKNWQLALLLSLVFAGFTFPYLLGHAANIRFKLDFEWIQTSVIALFISSTFLRSANSRRAQI